MGKIFPNLSADQLDCLEERLGDVDPSSVVTQAQEIAEECDIDRADLTPDLSAVSIPELSDLSIPDDVAGLIGRFFPNLSDEQVNCLADELGGDFDVSKIPDLADTCDVDPADMVPG